jgi:hypothetical protein
MMNSGCVRLRFFLILLLLPALSSIAIPAQAEWYVAGQAGYSFAGPLRNVTTTGPFSGIELQDFDLNNSVTYGGKVGVYPFHGSLGFELDVNHSTPHVKSLGDSPGIPSGGDECRREYSVAVPRGDLSALSRRRPGNYDCELESFGGDAAGHTGLDRATPILIPIMVIPPADRLLVSMGQAPALRLQRMHRHECSSERTRRGESPSVAVY